MAFRRGSPPDDYPVIRAPPMRPPPGRPPPVAPRRTVHFDDRPSYLESPPRGGFPPGVSPPRRFVGDSPPQRYLEGPPSGYQDSPPRRFPTRRSNPPPQYLSPEDSPPYRYSEEAPRRHPVGGSFSRPYAEDAPLPDDIDGPPPPGFRDEVPPRRFRGPSGFQGAYHSESESPSPPPGYFRPPPPPPGGILDESPRRFGGSPGQFRRHTDDDSPPTRYADEAPRRFGDAPPRQQLYDRSPPSPVYAEDQARRFRGSPHQFRDESPPRYADEAPRRFAGSPRRGSPPSPPPGGGARRGYVGDPALREEVSSAPPRRPGGRGGYVDDPTRREEFSNAPPQRTGGPPDRGHTSPPRFEGGALPPRLSTQGTPPTRAEDPPPGRFAAAPQQFPAGSPAGPQGAQRPLGSDYRDVPPGRLGEERQFAAGAAGAGLAGYAEDFARRQGPGGPPPQPVTPGFGPPPRQFPSGGPPPRNIGIGNPPRQQPGGFPPGAPPPGADPGLPPGTPPRFPPEVFAAGAIARRPSPGRGSSAGSSPPGLVRYSGVDPVPLGTPPEASPPDGVVYGGPRAPLGSTSPQFTGLGGRFEPSPDVYGALPPHATPPREGYRPPPPGLGQGGDAPLLGVPPGYATPQRVPLGGIGPGGTGNSPPIPDFLFYRPQKKQPSGYTAHSPPRQPPPRRPGPEHDAIFTADVVPIQLDDKLKEVAPHRGNPGSSTGGAWKDMWAGLLFLLQIGGVAALCVIFGLQGLTHTILHYSEPHTFHINNWLPQLGAAAVTGAAFAILWQHVIRLAPVLMILLTIWTGAALMILVGIVLISTGSTVGLIGIAFFFGGLCQALYAFVVRERIPFAAEMLKKVILVCNTYPSTYGVSYTFLLVSLGWMAIWIFGFSGSGIRPEHALIMAGLIASLVWTMQVFRNIVRVTVAGTVGLFYFQEKNMPRMATPIALLRACTISLGSICFGSLFVPLVEAPCHALRRVNEQAGASEFLFSCVVCFLAVYETLIRYFNKMGYIQVAIYGKPFVRASKDTWDMLRAQQVDALVHDDLTSTVLVLACGLGGSLSALVGGIYTFVAHKSLTIVITIVSYIIGAQLTYITMAVVESAVATYYVCFAEDPDSLQRHDGPFYERMWVRQMELTTPVTELSD
ncbi:unnamed protein product [Calypogeia fissa]